MDKNEVDFITPLRALEERNPWGKLDKANWRKLALCLYALVKNAIILDKPELIQLSKDGFLEVYGGSKVSRQPDGRIKVEIRGMVSDTSVNSIAAELHHVATLTLQREYSAKVLDFATKKAYGTDNNYPPILRDCMYWVLENMAFKWWSRKHSRAVEIDTLMKHIWDNNILDRKVFGLGVRLRGRDLPVSVYNAAAINFEALSARIAEAPNLAPMLLDAGYCWGAERDPLTGMPPASLLTHPNSIQSLRDNYLKNGWSPKGWRWFSHQGWTTVHFIKHSGDSSSRLASMVEALAAAQVGCIPRVPRNALLGAMNQLPPARYAGMAKCLTEAVRKRKLKVRDAADQLPLVVDFLRTFKGEDASMLKGASWASLVRRQHEWHIKRARTQREAMRGSSTQYFWAPLVQEVTLGAFKAISLNESGDLWEEGDAQGHCVGGYAPQCFNNRSRIYSIRNEQGGRVATLEVRLVANKWVQGQLYGASNKLIKDPAVIKLAKRVISQCNKADPLKPEANRKVSPQDNSVKWLSDLIQQDADNDEVYAQVAHDIPF